MSVSRICDTGMSVKFEKSKADAFDQDQRVLCTFVRQGGLHVCPMRLKQPHHVYHVGQLTHSTPVRPPTDIRVDKGSGGDAAAGGTGVGVDGVGMGGTAYETKEILTGEGAQPIPEGEEINTDEDVEPIKTLPTPDLPTPAALEEHRVTHLPYRSWCDDCVEAMAREFGHKTAEQSGRRIPIIGFEYLAMSRRGFFERSGFEPIDGESVAKVLAIKDSMSNELMAHMVPQKGLDERRFVIDMVLDEIEWMGYSKAIPKSDNEKASVSMPKAALQAMKRLDVAEQASGEAPPPTHTHTQYDPQSNGSVESGVRLAEQQINVINGCIERRLDFRIPPTHPIVAYLIRHAAMLRTYRVRDHAGYTAYQGLKGRPSSTRLIGFGEMCGWKLRSREHMGW